VENVTDKEYMNSMTHSNHAENHVFHHVTLDPC
jgi:hypothetical protein